VLDRDSTEHRPRLASRSAEARARATVERHYGELEDRVLRAVRRKLNARNIPFDDSDLREAYGLAWHGLYEQLRGDARIDSLTAMLVTITFRRAIDEYRHAHPHRPPARTVAAAQHDPLELDELVDDRLRLERLVAGLRERLDERERAAAALCLIHGYTRAEAAALLGLSAPRMNKLMDRVTAKIAGVVAAIDARGCGGPEWTRLLRAHAFGQLAPDARDHPRVLAHLDACASCRRYVLCLRGLAAVAPPSLLPLPRGGGGRLHRFLGRLRAHGRGALGRVHGGGVGGGVGGAGGSAGGGSSGGVGGAGGGGSGLLGTLGGGTLAKGAAVVVAVGAIAAGGVVAGRSGGVAAHSRAATAAARVRARDLVAITPSPGAPVPGLDPPNWLSRGPHDGGPRSLRLRHRRPGPGRAALARARASVRGGARASGAAAAGAAGAARGGAVGGEFGFENPVPSRARDRAAANQPNASPGGAGGDVSGGRSGGGEFGLEQG
jgi:DNA-directed RNA polymerase specialized sigma24 family protein